MWEPGDTCATCGTVQRQAADHGQSEGRLQRVRARLRCLLRGHADPREYWTEDTIEWWCASCRARWTEDLR